MPKSNENSLIVIINYVRAIIEIFGTEKRFKRVKKECKKINRKLIED